MSTTRKLKLTGSIYNIIKYKRKKGCLIKIHVLVKMVFRDPQSEKSLKLFLKEMIILKRTSLKNNNNERYS